MPTPPKPYVVLKGEKKSHRTKAELEQRKKGEEGLASGKAFKERKEVKDNEVAHKEFKRINTLLKGIEKNDALYEPVINRYCIIQAECQEMEEERKYMLQLIDELKTQAKEIKGECKTTEYTEFLVELTRGISQIYGKVMALDKTLLSKRKMLLDIEKENVMTIASALRSIPKKEEKASNPLLEALRNG